MNKSADIERIFAHIGTPEMKYHEFEPAPDTDQARANWSLLHSATEPGEEGQEALAPTRPEPPEQRADAFRERMSERTVRQVRPDAATEAGPASTGTPPDQPPGRPLQQVFSRLTGRPSAAETRPEPAAEPRAATPLSQVFKRLT